MKKIEAKFNESESEKINEIGSMNHRLVVLEKIITDKWNLLDSEINKL